MPARSKSQQRLFGMLHAYNKGEFHGNKRLNALLKNLSEHISDEDARHFAETKHKDLPEKKSFCIKGSSYIRDTALMKLADQTTSPRSAGTNVHKVVPGDTLSEIGRKYGVGTNILQKINGLTDPDKIKPGQILRLKDSPPASAPVKKPGIATPKPPTSHQTGINAVASELHRQFNNSELEAAILANIDRETGGTFDYKVWNGFKKQNFDVNKRQQQGYGLFQLVGPNQDRYKKWLISHNYSDSMPNQISFIRSVYGPERTGWKKNVSNQSGLTREQLADWWHRMVETPAHVLKGTKYYDQDRTNRATEKHNVFMRDKIRRVNGYWVGV